MFAVGWGGGRERERWESGGGGVVGRGVCGGWFGVGGGDKVFFLDTYACRCERLHRLRYSGFVFKQTVMITAYHHTHTGLVQRFRV